MITQAKIHLYLPCPGCIEKSHKVDQLNIGQGTVWSCDNCYNEFRIKRITESDFETEITGRKQTPITVTLRSVTEPPITLKLNSWKYAHSQRESVEEFTEHERYFYNEHTCPTNWTRQIEHIEFEGDNDPHGVFQFVSVEDGHFVDPD